MERSHHWIAITLGTLLAIGLILGAISWALANFAITIPKVPSHHESPAKFNLPFENRSVISSDGYHLKGWWIPANADAPSLPPVIIIHGLGASKEFMLGFINLAHIEGYPVLAIDLRGHGESDSSPTTLGANEPIDIAAWIVMLKEEGYPHCILWGTSLGAVTALRAAAVNPEVVGVIADAPFDTLRHTLQVHAKLFFHLPSFPLIPIAIWQIEHRMHVKIDQVDCYQAVKRIHVPVLLMAGSNDHRMTPASIYEIFKAANEPKQFYVIPGADHETRAFQPEYQQEITSFLTSCSTPVSRPETATAATR